MKWNPPQTATYVIIGFLLWLVFMLGVLVGTCQGCTPTQTRYVTDIVLPPYLISSDTYPYEIWLRNEVDSVMLKLSIVYGTTPSYHSWRFSTGPILLTKESGEKYQGVFGILPQLEAGRWELEIVCFVRGERFVFARQFRVL